MKSNGKNKKDKGINGRQMRKFVTLVGSIVGTFLFVSAIAVFGYLLTVTETPASTTVGSVNVPDLNNTKQGGFLPDFLKPPKKTNVLIVGVDEHEMLTDVTIFGSFDSDTKQISLISIPRDTYVVIDKADIETLRGLGKYLPSDGVMKINAIHSYAGNTYGIQYLEKEVEEIFDVEVHYYVLVNLKAFRSIVDAVGGVRMDIPSGGLYYSDPYQNLVINVPGGPNQLLDGELAEGVVRFRDTYARGDLQRIEVQQEFMHQFFNQVLNKEALMSNAASFITTIINYVKTDFGIQDIPKYLKYIDELKPENLVSYTLPGEAYKKDGVSFFFHDKEATAEMAYEIFVKEEEPEPLEEPESTELEIENAPEDNNSASTEKPEIQKPEINASEIKLQVLNGGNITGKAAEISNNLKSNGFNVVNIDNYSGTKRETTRIITREAGMAELFEEYFHNITEEIDSDLSDKYDVVIIVGTSEK